MRVIGLVVGDDGTRGELSFHGVFGESTLGVYFFVVVDIFVRERREVLLVDGLVVVLVHEGVVHRSVPFRPPRGVPRVG